VVLHYTANAHLQKPSTSDRNWDVSLNANFDYLDGISAIGGLVVTTTETPSTTLNVRVSAGNYGKSDGSVGTYAGASSISLPASSTTSLWLTDAGVLTTGTGFPSTLHVRLASVVAGSSAIGSVTDQRVQCESSGSAVGFILKSGDILTDGANFTLGATLGTQIATSATQKLGFFGSVPASQAAGVALLTDATGGTVGGGLNNVGTSFSQVTINSNFATLAATVNALVAALKRNGLMAS
jgi:hypothetical protein